MASLSPLRRLILQCNLTGAIHIWLFKLFTWTFLRMPIAKRTKLIILVIMQKASRTPQDTPIKWTKIWTLLLPNSNIYQLLHGYSFTKVDLHKLKIYNLIYNWYAGSSKIATNTMATILSDTSSVKTKQTLQLTKCLKI